MSATRTRSASPCVRTPAVPTHTHLITVNNDAYRIWTKGKTFHHENYFTVRKLLEEYEWQHDEVPIAALKDLEGIVFEYLMSDDSKKDKEKFELLVHAGSTGQTERMVARLKALLEARKEEKAAKVLTVDLRQWEKSLAVAKRHTEQLLRDEAKKARMLGDIDAQSMV